MPLVPEDFFVRNGSIKASVLEKQKKEVEVKDLEKLPKDASDNRDSSSGKAKVGLRIPDRRARLRSRCRCAIVVVVVINNIIVVVIIINNIIIIIVINSIIITTTHSIR